MTLRCGLAVWMVLAGSACAAPADRDCGPHLNWEGLLHEPSDIHIRVWDVVVNPEKSRADVRYRYHMSRPLTDRCDQDIELHVLRGEGVSIRQQPRSSNGHIAVIHVDVSKQTRVAFTASWCLYPHGWFDASISWWAPRDVVQWSGNGSGSVEVVCRDRRCWVRRGHGRDLEDRFDFDLPLPKRPTGVVFTHVMATAACSLKSGKSQNQPCPAIGRPSRGNSYSTRVWVELDRQVDYAFRLTWSPAPDPRE